MKRSLALLTLVFLACRARTLDLGVNDLGDASIQAPPEDAGIEAPADAPVPTFEERLRALCQQPPGSADRYSSARELTAKISARWFLCDDPSASPLQLPDGVQFGTDGLWSMLIFDQARTSLVPWDDPDKRGGFDYLAFSDPDAGAGADAGGTSSQVVSRDDPAPRGGIFVYLHRGISNDIVVQIELEQSTTTRRMLLREVGPSQRQAFYVLVP